MYSATCVYACICIHVKNKHYICSVSVIVTENIWKKQNVKTLSFDAYLVFTKILEANLCFGTNFPWGINCQIPVFYFTYSTQFSWVFECMKSILEVGGQALRGILRKILWVIVSKEGLLMTHISCLPKGTVRVLWMHLPYTTTARGSGETMTTPHVYAASLY